MDDHPLVSRDRTRLTGQPGQHEQIGLLEKRRKIDTSAQLYVTVTFVAPVTAIHTLVTDMKSSAEFVAVLTAQRFEVVAV